MGIEPFLVSSSVNCVVAQRLARTVCSECVEPDRATTAAELEAAGLSAKEAAGATAVKGRGCNLCSDTGFKGRIAIYEVMVLTDTLRDFVLNGASAAEIRKEATRQGMKTLRRSALNKLVEGATTLSEVFRISAADN